MIMDGGPSLCHGIFHIYLYVPLHPVGFVTQLLLCLCLTIGNSECVQLMIDQGAFMEAHDCHYGTPLHVACARQHYDCAKVLLNAGE